MAANIFRYAVLINNHLKLYQPIRHAGHAKWQNIRGTKMANDLAKGKLISRYVMMVRRAIVSNNMRTDPKLNSKLAQVLAEANKFNVPKATLDRAIARSANVKIISCLVCVKGQEGWSLIAKCETDNKNFLKRDIRKALKKFDCGILTDDTMVNMFKQQGYVRTATKDAQGIEITLDKAEEAAISADAEDVVLEVYDENSASWCFSTSAETVNKTKDCLSKLGFQIDSADTDLEPYTVADFGPQTSKNIKSIVEILREIDNVIDVYHNVKLYDDE